MIAACSWNLFKRKTLCVKAQARRQLKLNQPLFDSVFNSGHKRGSLACSGSGPLVGNVLWWEMSSHRKCPLVGVSLPLHFSTLRQEKASGGKSPVVGTKLWWCLPHLFSNASRSSKLFSPKALLDKGVLPRHSCSTRRFFPTTPAPPGVSFPPLLLHKGLLHTVLFPPLLFHMFFFPTTPASQGFASHSSLPTTPVPQVFSFPPLLLHKGLFHTVLFPPLLFHKFFLSHQSCSTRACFTQFSPHHSCSTRVCFTQFSPHHSCFTRVCFTHFSPHHSCFTKVCFPTTLAALASQGFAFPPLLLRKGLFTHHSCSTRLCLKTFHHFCFTETCFTRFSLHSGFTRLDHTRTTPASLEFASLDSPTAPV